MVMKKLYSLLLIMAFGVYTYAQQIPVDSVKDKAYYLEKRKSQRTTGWIIFGVGGALTLSGIIWASTQPNPFSTNQSGNTSSAPYVMLVGGFATMLASIPFLFLLIKIILRPFNYL